MREKKDYLGLLGRKPLTMGERKRGMVMTVYVVLARNAAKFPDKEALCRGDRRRTRGEPDRRVFRPAGAMGGRGIEKGDKVAILLENCDHFVEIWFTLARLEGGGSSPTMRWRQGEGQVCGIGNSHETRRRRSLCNS
ncbi:MAG: AMP-binding protein [Peptococcaceae bacterium]|nr:AMP-binding protein [Peptococcaceae bacterium]